MLRISLIISFLNRLLQHVRIKKGPYLEKKIVSTTLQGTHWGIIFNSIKTTSQIFWLVLHSRGFVYTHNWTTLKVF